MANIQPQIDDIRKAKFGRDVRESIASGLEAMNAESGTAYSAAITAQNSATNSANQAAQSATDAGNSAFEAKTAETNAKSTITTVEGFKNEAQSARDAAVSSATAAGNSEKNAKASEDAVRNIETSLNAQVTVAVQAANTATSAATDANASKTQASQSATNAQTYAASASNAQTAAAKSEANAKTSADKAEAAAQAASSIAGIGVADDKTPGIISYDNVTIKKNILNQLYAAGLTEHINNSLISDLQNPEGVHGVRIYIDQATKLTSLQQWNASSSTWIDVITGLKVDGNTIKMDPDGTIRADVEQAELDEHVESKVASADGIHGFRITEDGDDATAEYLGADGQWHELASSTKYVVRVTTPEPCTVHFGSMTKESTVSEPVVEFIVKDISQTYTYYAVKADGTQSEVQTIQISNPVTELVIVFDAAVITVTGTKTIKKAADVMPGYTVNDPEYDLADNLAGYSVGIYDQGSSSPFATETFGTGSNPQVNFSFKPSEHPNVYLKTVATGSELGRCTVLSSQNTEQLVFNNIINGSSLSGSFAFTEKWAQLEVTTSDAELKSTPVVLTYGSGKSITGTWNATDKCVFIVKLPSTSYTVSCGSANPWSGNTPSVLPNGLWQSIEMSNVKIKPFATATDEEIVDIVNGYYDGTFTLAEIQEVWKVGDTRTIHLNAMPATYVGEVQPEQDIEINIIGFEHDDLTTAQGGKSKALLTLQTVPSLATVGYISSSDASVGGWNGCARRSWCNNVFINALANELKAIVKSVNKISSAGNQSTSLQTTSDKAFLLSENEIFGAKTYSTGNEGTRYAYYANGGSTVKSLNGGSAGFWWERSPYPATSNSFCAVLSNGAPDVYPARNTFGLAPAFCL